MSVKIPVYKVKLVRDHTATYPGGIVEDPKATAAFFHALIGSADREHFAALFVDGGRPTGATIIAIGSLSRVVLHVREVFRAAIAAGADSMIVSHNHPVAVPFPSASDLRLTRRLISAGRIIGIPITDHFIVSTSGEFTAMKVHASVWGVSEAA